MVMDMRHKCNYKIRKNKISRTITRAFAWSIAFQNPIYPIVASQPSFAVARDISLPASLLIHRERLLNTFWSCYLQLKVRSRPLFITEPKETAASPLPAPGLTVNGWSVTSPTPSFQLIFKSLAIPILFLFYCKDSKTNKPQPALVDRGSITLCKGDYNPIDFIIFIAVILAACAQVHWSLAVTLTVCTVPLTSKLITSLSSSNVESPAA